MFTKTSSYFFQKYGDTYLNLPNICDNYIQNSFIILNKSIDSVCFANDDIFIHVEEGIVILYISYDNTSESYEPFVIHHTIKIKKNSYFNFITISDNSKINVYYPNKHSLSLYPINGNVIVYNPIKPKINIDEILVYYHQIKSSDYIFHGEKHHFWELTYVDNGHLITEVDGIEYTLKQHDIMLYAPEQFHTQKMDGKEACSYLTIIFKMDFINTSLLSNQIFKSSRKIISSLEDFISICEKPNPYFNDLCISYLTQTIIQLLQFNDIKITKMANSPIQQKIEDQFLNDIISYINYNYALPLTVEQICQKFSVSRNSLQLLFKKNLNVPPKQYIAQVKLKKAKILIKENKYTISEISEMLGFTSIHYFSRKFKKEFNLSPSEYAKSIYK